MKTSINLPKERWRRLGTINVSLICCCGIILLVCLLISIARFPGSTGGLFDPVILHHGDCKDINSLDVILHLFINIFSTAVLASSNFFMQIVSSPTRKEADYAHRSLHALEVGVSSFKNLGALSWFKSLAWAGLLLSSVPIHLLFNSAIYSTGYEGTTWQLIIATESFVDQTVDHFVPGASLASPGSACPSSPHGTNSTCTFLDVDPMSGNFLSPSGDSGYGLDVDIEGADYWNSANQNVTKAAEYSSTWKYLTPTDCYDEYRFCTGRKEYRDLVVVVAVASGWTRSQMYNFSGAAATNLSQFWDSHISNDSTNSLWYSTTCLTKRDVQATTDSCNSYDNEQLTRTGCAGALGEPHGVDWINTTKLQTTWKIPFIPYGMIVPSDFGYNNEFNELTVKHCLAEPNPDYSCKVGLAPLLLLVVIGCSFLKVCICIAILWRLTHESLVTPGDAIASFISRPDMFTMGLGTLGYKDSDRLEYKSIEKLPDIGLFSGPRARRWKVSSPRYKSVLSAGVWVRTYTVLGVGLSLLAVGLVLVVVSDGASSLKDPIGSSTITMQADFGYFGSLLFANSPQLILSICYFSFNAIFTRMQAEREWNSYSLSYRPLRVSDPKGEQISNYRLQLPYKYSIPLMGLSILLHWLLSNAIYLTIKEGGFWDNSDQEQSTVRGFGVTDNPFVAVGISGQAVLILLIISGVLCFLPVIFSFRKSPGDMVSGGTNSLVISAACHVSVMGRKSKSRRISADSRTRPGTSTNMAEQASDRGTSSILNDGQRVSMSSIDVSIEEPRIADDLMSGIPLERLEQREGEEDEQRLLPDMTPEESEEHELSLLQEVATSKVRWGAVSLRPDMSHGLEAEETVMHLGFGTEEDDVQPPQEDHLYF